MKANFKKYLVGLSIIGCFIFGAIITKIFITNFYPSSVSVNTIDYAVIGRDIIL